MSKKLRCKISLLNWVFVVQLVLFGLIITGVLPRVTAVFLAVGLAVYVAIAKLEDSTVFFVRSIPLFIAIPITATFDNFNTWRILAIIIFLKWLFVSEFSIFNLKFLIKSQFLKFKNIISIYRPSFLFIILFFIAVLSIIPASDKVAAITRIIYFVNLSLIGIVVWDLSQCNSNLRMRANDANKEVEPRKESFTKRIVKNIAIPTIIVTVVGYVQLASTYFIDVYQFMRIWGEGIQMRQFGTLWSEIAVRLGNTWLAYYGEQLSLRVFSLFPDSHSFPQFVLLGLPAIMAISLYKIVNGTTSSRFYPSQSDDNKIEVSRSGDARSRQDIPLRKMVRTRADMSVLWIPAMFLIVILSGTRGIWAASIGVVFIIFFVLYWFKKEKRTLCLIHDREINTMHLDYSQTIFQYISLYLFLFFMLFAVAYPIFTSPQFLVGKADTSLFSERIKSIVDFGETSNSQRIEIWKASLGSIKERPFLGVGIGNFPVVLEQRVFLARAGSSAHNIYLHIAAEMGISSLLVVLWFLWLVLKKSYENFKNSILCSIHDRVLNTIPRDSIPMDSTDSLDCFLGIYFAATLIFVPWILIYSLTDIALLDERAFLLFVVTVALIFSDSSHKAENKKQPQIGVE